MGTVKHGHIPVRHPSAVQLIYASRYPFCLLLAVFAVVAHYLGPGGQRRYEVLFYSVAVAAYEGVGRRQYLGSGTVVLHHHHGLGARKGLIKIQQIFHVCAAPRVYGLIRIAHYEQIFMITAQYRHELILQVVYILKLVYHYVFQPLLPLEPYMGVFRKYVQSELYEVVVVEGKALLLLIEIAVEYYIPGLRGRHVLFPKCVEGHVHHVQIILRLFEELLYFYHVPGVRKGHVS